MTRDVLQGYQCGMLWGAVLAAGAQAYRLYGAGPRAEAAAMYAAEKLAGALRDSEGDINCLEITETDWHHKWQVAKFMLKGGAVGCVRRTARFAPLAFAVINDALAEAPHEAPAGLASCAA